MDRHLLFTLSAMFAVSCTGAMAQPKVLFVAGAGGSTETTFRQLIIPPFEAMHGVRVEYVAGNSTDNLARMQAQRAKPELDVAHTVDPLIASVSAVVIGTTLMGLILMDRLFGLDRLLSANVEGAR